MPTEMNITGHAELSLSGQTMMLLPQRGIFWKETATLLVADVHFGKAATFRALNIAIPAGTTEKDLDSLTWLLRETSAQRLIFLGDLIHSPRGLTERICSLIADWRAHHSSIEMILVKGNHDRKTMKLAEIMRLEIVEEPYIVGPFALKHHPKEHEENYVLCGHTHPAVRLRGAGQKSLRLPCFSFGERIGILPAFGSFTGCAEIEPQDGERIFVVAEDQIVEVF